MEKVWFCFLNGNVIADSTVKKLYLGRPWRAFAKTAFIGCNLPEQIAPEGWNNWGNPENEQTTLYAEYNNTGKGAVTAKRVPWAKILTEKEAMAYTLENIFAPTGLAEGGNAWFLNLKTGRFVLPGLKK